jgi:hypothetical protein
MAFRSDLLKKRLGLELRAKRIRVEAGERSSGSFGDSKNQASTKRGRPKKALTVQIRAYEIVECPHHAEVMAAIVAAHAQSEPSEALEPVLSSGESSAPASPPLPLEDEPDVI